MIKVMHNNHKTTKINKNLIAACGMDCGLCLHYLRAENKCPGCFTGRKVNNKPIKCGIIICRKRRGEYCFDCDEFPCERLKTLDKRYRIKYGMSEIENLHNIKEKGIDNFVKSECEKYQSSKGTLCIHNKKYYR